MSTDPVDVEVKQTIDSAINLFAHISKFNLKISPAACQSPMKLHRKQRSGRSGISRRIFTDQQWPTVYGGSCIIL